MGPIGITFTVSQALVRRSFNTFITLDIHALKLNIVMNDAGFTTHTVITAS